MRRGWKRIPGSCPQNIKPKTSVSIIIAARNEEDNIGNTLDCIIQQKFPKDLMEVIVVDDHSIDKTADIVRTYAKHGVTLLQLNEGDKLNSYKKLAISKAIACAKGEIIVTTDADCRMDNEWLQSVIEYFESNESYLVSSPVVYSNESSYFERLQTLEFLYLIGLGAAGIGNSKPTTCNGANLAYRRDVFYEMGGFSGIDNLASGDDELFLHKVAEKYADKIGFCKSRKAIVYTDAKPNLQAFISQRKRWASKSTKYKDKKVVILGIAIWLFNLAFIVSLIVGILIEPSLILLVLIVFILKVIVEYSFIHLLCSFVQRKELLVHLPILSLAHSLYLVYIGIAGNMGKYDWKGRNVN